MDLIVVLLFINEILSTELLDSFSSITNNDVDERTTLQRKRRHDWINLSDTDDDENVGSKDNLENSKVISTNKLQDYKQNPEVSGAIGLNDVVGYAYNSTDIKVSDKSNLQEVPIIDKEDLKDSGVTGINNLEGGAQNLEDGKDISKNNLEDGKQTLEEVPIIDKEDSKDSGLAGINNLDGGAQNLTNCAGNSNKMIANQCSTYTAKEDGLSELNTDKNDNVNIYGNSVNETNDSKKDSTILNTLAISKSSNFNDSAEFSMGLDIIKVEKINSENHTETFNQHLPVEKANLISLKEDKFKNSNSEYKLENNKQALNDQTIKIFTTCNQEKELTKLCSDSSILSVYDKGLLKNDLLNTQEEYQYKIKALASQITNSNDIADLAQNCSKLIYEILDIKDNCKLVNKTGLDRQEKVTHKMFSKNDVDIKQTPVKKLTFYNLPTKIKRKYVKPLRFAIIRKIPVYRVDSN